MCAEPCHVWQLKLIKDKAFKLWNRCVRLGAMYVRVGGHCPSSCLRWLSWCGLFPQFASTRNLCLFFGLWHLPSWYSGWSYGFGLRCHSWGLLVSLLVCVYLAWHSCPLVSPTYTCEQSLQGILYTNPVCCCSGVLVFTRISFLFRVLIGLTTGCTPSGVQTFSIILLSPLM